MQSFSLHTSSLYLFSLLSLSWGTSCSKGCRTDDWEDTNTHMSNSGIWPLWCKKSLFLQYWLVDQTCTNKGLKTEKLINWKTYFLNILTWQQTGINIYIYTTQNDGGKSCVSSPLLIENSEAFTDSWNYSNFVQSLWMVLRIFPYSIYTNTSTISTIEVSSFNLCCTEKFILLQNKWQQRKIDFLLKSSAQ